MTDSEGTEGELPTTTLTPSGLGQYISYSGCPRFFRLKYFDQDVLSERNWYDGAGGSNLFAELGLAYEAEQLATLAAGASKVIGDSETDGDPVDYDATWPESVERQSGDVSHEIETRWKHAVEGQIADIVEDLAARDPEELEGPVVLFQTPMYGDIGAWGIAGIADLITLEPLPDSHGVRSRILEVKTSWKDKTSHQIQSTIYSLLLDEVVSGLNLDHDPHASVVNREVDLREQSPEELPSIDRASRRAEIKRLLKVDGELHQLARQSFEEAGYRLERKCDGCPYNGVCYTKAIENKDPALLNLTGRLCLRFSVGLPIDGINES